MEKKILTKKRVIGAVVAVAVLSGVSFAAYAYNARYEPVSDVVKLELGKHIDTSDMGKYVDANSSAVKGTKLDVSKVNIKKVGTYPVTASYKGKTADFKIKVEDSVSPAVKLAENGEYKVVAGKKLPADNIVESMEDIAGIKSVKFKEAGYQDEKATEDSLKDKGVSYDKTGTYSNSILITDKNGNTTTKEFKVKVTEDYEKHVSGFHNFTVEVGGMVDYMSGIEKDERIADIQVDSSKVDLSKAGEYTVTYTITGDDKETKITKTAKVTVNAPVQTTTDNAGNSVASSSTSGGESYSSNSYSDTSGNTYGGNFGYDSGNSSYSNGSYDGGSSNSNGASNSGNNGFTIDGSGYFDGGSEESGANSWEGGTFDPSQYGF